MSNMVLQIGLQTLNLLLLKRVASSCRYSNSLNLTILPVVNRGIVLNSGHLVEKTQPKGVVS